MALGLAEEEARALVAKIRNHGHSLPPCCHCGQKKVVPPPFPKFCPSCQELYCAECSPDVPSQTSGRDPLPCRREGKVACKVCGEAIWPGE